MESIVFFGKGGIGKSTIASNISVLLAAGGGKVLHAGCDPKMDSTLALMGRHIQPFTAKSGNSGVSGLRESIYPSAVKGVYCIETGGPQPGVGCAGAGIGSMLDAMKDGRLLEDDGYTAAVFDVLGDVVCGGFAAPLRRGFAKKAVIVTSEEPLSLYAANRLIMMINGYARNGVYLAGLAANAKTREGAGLIEDFARKVNTRVLGVILRDPAVTTAEREHRPAAAAYPKSEFARRAARLCLVIRAAGAPKTPPAAMCDADFFAFAEGRRTAGAPKAAVPPPARAVRASGGGRGRVPAGDLFAGAGFSPSGMEGGQIICDWRSSGGVFKIVISPASSAQGGMTRFSDWAVCLHPSVGNDKGASGSELAEAAAPLASLRFDEMLSTFMGIKDFYSGLTTFALPDETEQGPVDVSDRPHIGFGQWQRFIFTSGGRDAYVPPGAVLVEHGDSECRFCFPEDAGMGMFGENAELKAPGRQAARGPLLPRSDNGIVNTDFNAQDAVFGDEDKILESLYAAAERTGRGGFVEFYTGCSPMLLASDTASISRRVEREKGVKIILENYNSFTEHGRAKTLARVDFMAERLLRAPGRKTRDVNLVDFGRTGDGLAELLAASGISVVGHGQPSSAGAPGRPGTPPASVPEDFYSEARSARLQVLERPDAVLGPAFDKAGLKWILPPAPYGFSGTDSCLKAIAGALRRRSAGIGPSAVQKVEAMRLFRRARAYSAGFVLDPAELGPLPLLTAFKTVPVLQVLAEAGFKLRIFLMASGTARLRNAAKRAYVKELQGALPGGRVSAEVFSAPGELQALLRSDKSIRLVYSDIRRDPRVVSAGKNPFSAALFQPGYCGALETWRRLLELCEWDFNERYLHT